MTAMKKVAITQDAGFATLAYETSSIEKLREYAEMYKSVAGIIHTASGLKEFVDESPGCDKPELEYVGAYIASLKYPVIDIQTFGNKWMDEKNPIF